MDWNDLRYVLAISRDRTLLSAAAKLGVAHTTVSRRVKALEDQLRVRLFDRTPDGFIPTAAGEDLVAAAERMEDQVLAAEGRVLGRDARLRGALRVSTADILFQGFPDAFASFIARYPSIHLTVATSSEPASLTRREADTVLRLSNAPPEHFVGRRIGHVQFAVYASGELVEQVGEGAPLSAYPWIGWDERQDFRWFDQWLASNAPGAKTVFRLDNNTLLRGHAIRAGMGAQILPCFLADPDPDLQRIAPLDDTFRLDLWLLTLAELRANSRVRAFMGHMADALGAHRDALAGRRVGTVPSDI
ncbi:MAG: LysR family transcriptional regulator [Xanthomonadales bacterium]|nr:LysR family transcriptional regulator [Xanthomonadales bacterium]